MKKDLGLYLHVPFCVKKCDYCDFLSKEAAEEEKEAYVDALIKEIKSYKKFAGNYKVSTVFVGGGTPSCLRAEQTKRIFDALYEIFEFVKHPEITTEMNPGTVDREKLEVYKACGINRLSIGMQSVKDENLKVLGRIHNFEQLLEVYQLAREAGFTNINPGFDVLFAFSDQRGMGRRTAKNSGIKSGTHFCVSAYHRRGHTFL